jgi:hypothetical protein
LVRYTLSLHGLIPDTGAAEVQAEQYIRRALDDAAYDHVHGRGAADHKALQDAKAEVATWPAWKQGSGTDARRTG